ncbi:MAG: sodium:proton exchanger, partial [Elusimicrobiaceae bacterium]|nr:sodium:proton exchanger [Elusimicrobiaceae bacterium]
MEISIIFFGAIVFLAHLFVAVFEKTRIPDVLPLIFLGVLLGPVFGLVRPSDFGNIADIFITISLIVILFQSGLELKLSQIRDSWLASSKLAVLNFFGSLIIITLFGTILLNTDLVSSLILASILAGTSFGVVIPLVSKLTVSNNCKTTLT